MDFFDIKKRYYISFDARGRFTVPAAIRTLQCKYVVYVYGSDEPAFMFGFRLADVEPKMETSQYFSKMDSCGKSQVPVGVFSELKDLSEIKKIGKKIKGKKFRLQYYEPDIWCIRVDMAPEEK